MTMLPKQGLVPDASTCTLTDPQGRPWHASSRSQNSQRSKLSRLSMRASDCQASFCFSGASPRRRGGGPAAARSVRVDSSVGGGNNRSHVLLQKALSHQLILGLVLRSLVCVASCRDILGFFATCLYSTHLHTEVLKGRAVSRFSTEYCTTDRI